MMEDLLQLLRVSSMPDDDWCPLKLLKSQSFVEKTVNKITPATSNLYSASGRVGSTACNILGSSIGLVLLPKPSVGPDGLFD